MKTPDQLLLAYYGDDFTGSTDALEVLGKAGVRAVLFLKIPTTGMLARFENVDAIGLAGMTRAMDPVRMASELDPAFATLKSLNPTHVHYKVCSTFDSSPQIGNIGVAIQKGESHFDAEFIPVLVASPSLGRYSAFGNLFARMGIGSQGGICRLDRHPSMCRHPVTPAEESDLRRHLSRQAAGKMGLIDLTDLENPPEMILQKLDRLISEGYKIVFFDALYQRQMKLIGELLEAKAGLQTPLFSVGSSGIETALCDHWVSEGRFQRISDWDALPESKPLLVLSGSVSPVTGEQIDRAVKSGFAEIAVAPEAVINTVAEDNAVEEYARELKEHLNKGRSIILHTSRGPGDPRIRKLAGFFRQSGWDETKIRLESAERFGRILGRSARLALTDVPVNRLVIAGGDTSGYAAGELGIEALEMIGPLVPGAPVCRAHAPGSPVDGKEVNFKGGQVGDMNYFGILQNGNR